MSRLAGVVAGLIALAVLVIGPLAGVASASPGITASITPVGGPVVVQNPPFICATGSGSAPTAGNYLPINRWASAAGPDLHSDLSGGFFGVSDLPQIVQRGGIEAVTLGVGNTAWRAATGLVSAATQFCIGDVMGLRINEVTATIGKAVLTSPLIAALLAVAVVLTLLAAARGREKPFRRLMASVLAVGILIAMVAGASAPATSKVGNRVTFGTFSPGWLISKSFNVVNTVASLPAGVFNQASTHLGPLASTGPMSCGAFFTQLEADYTASYQQGAANTTAAALPIALNNLWEQTGLVAYTDAQFGAGDPYGPYAYCRLLEDDINASTRADQALTAAAAASAGGASYQAIAAHSNPSALAWAPTASNSTAYVDRSIIGWAACRPNPGHNPPWGVTSGWASVKTPSGASITPSTCAQWYSGNDSSSSSMSSSGLAWGTNANANANAAAAAPAVSNFILTFHGNNNASGIATAVLFMLASMVIFVVFAVLALAIIIAKVALLVLGMLAVVVAAVAIIPSSGAGNRALSVARHALGMIVFAVAAQTLLSLVAVVTGMILSVSTGGGPFVTILFASFAPVAAIVLIHLLFTKILKAPTPFKASGALAYGAAAGGIGAGLGAGLDRFVDRGRRQAIGRAGQVVSRGRAGYGAPRPHRTGALRAGASRPSILAESTAGGALGAAAGAAVGGSGGAPGGAGDASGSRPTWGGGGRDGQPLTDRQAAKLGRESEAEAIRTEREAAGGRRAYALQRAGEAIRERPVGSAAKVATGTVGLAAAAFVPFAAPVIAAGYGAHKVRQHAAERRANRPAYVAAGRAEAARRNVAARAEATRRDVAARTVSHDEAIQARKTVTDFKGYQAARANGASAAETMAAHSARADLGGYAKARKHATHYETMYAHAAKVNLGGYAQARRVTTHNETMDAHHDGWDLAEYARMRSGPGAPRPADQNGDQGEAGQSDPNRQSDAAPA